MLWDLKGDVPIQEAIFGGILGCLQGYIMAYGGALYNVFKDIIYIYPKELRNKKRKGFVTSFSLFCCQRDGKDDGNGY